MNRDSTISKSQRLRKRRDFRFQNFRKWQSENFLFVYSAAGKGRLGVSLSKKVLKLAVARNRIRRLIWEAFRNRKSDMHGFDLHIIGRAGLKEKWKSLKIGDLHHEFQSFLKERQTKNS